MFLMSRAMPIVPMFFATHKITQGITYSMMSASWDPEREGSVLGTDEFSRNIDNIKGGLSRSKENAQVREQIMLEENFARQKIQKEKPKKPAATSLAEKMGDELE